MASGDDRQQTVFAVVLASAVAQVGCVAIAVILGALAVGLGLDRLLDTKPLFTLLLILVSIPVSLYLLVRIALSSVTQLTAPPAEEAEEESSGEV